MTQLILHLIGDYITQSDWMAQNKRKSSIAAGLHAIIYSLPFLLLQPSWAAFAVILGTHFLIDRFGLARYVVWAKNVVLSPYFHGFRFLNHRKLYTDESAAIAREWARLRWENCSNTGYPDNAPPFLAVWLLIIADNTLHLALNYAALRWL
jgi:hypothetical protein